MFFHLSSERFRRVLSFHEEQEWRENIAVDFFLASVQKSQNPVQNYNHIVKNGKETKRNISFHGIFDVLQEHFGVCSSFRISSYLSNKSLFCSKCLVHTFLWLLLADKSIQNDIEHYLCVSSNLTTESLIGCSYHHQGTWAGQ